MKIIIILSSALLMALSCSKKENSAEKLSLHLTKGFEQTLIYSTSTEGNKNGGMNDVTEVKYRVDSIDRDSSYCITGEIMRMTFNQSMFGQEIHYDSREESGSDDGMGEEFRPLIHNPFVFKIDKYGKVLKKQKFSREVPEDMNAESYNIIPLVFPSETVEKGFSWKEKVASPLMKSMSVSNTYTYKGIRDQRIEISVRSMMPGFSGFTEDTEIEGKYLFDRKTGVLISAEKNMPVQTGGGTASFSIMPKVQGFN